MSLSNKKIKANAVAFKKSMVTMWAMVKKNIKNQYRRSVLGILWTVLNPLLTMLVMVFVFSSIFRFSGNNLDYPVYILTGNIVFGFVSGATVSSLPCMVDNYDLLMKTRVRHFIFPAANVVSSLVNFGFSLIALFLVMIIRYFSTFKSAAGPAVSFQPHLLMIVVWLPAILMFCFGMALILSALYVRFRDIKHLYNVFLTLWMYATPIFYSPNDIGDLKVRNILKYNPLYHYLAYFRDLVTGSVPGWEAHLIIYGIGIGLMVIGLLFFRSQRKSFVLYI